MKRTRVIESDSGTGKRVQARELEEGWYMGTVDDDMSRNDGRSGLFYRNCDGVIPAQRDGETGLSLFLRNVVPVNVEIRITGRA